MAKRSSTTKPTKRVAAPAPARTAGSASTSAMERQVLAFAEQLGYVAGTIQSRAGGLMDRETLSRQVASVRDGAKQLLEQLATATRAREAPASVPAPAPRKARSGGAVDAPGKKHRRPAPTGPAAVVERAQAAKLRAAMPMAKTHMAKSYNHRARG